ncbi:hypothetical protein PQQ88_08870 [Paraburkholderia caledonica]|uniref:hypothetical protein n=1 Tax=Paraburkholderia caledonica TaxID=134536 RepID=UPI0038BD6F95
MYVASLPSHAKQKEQALYRQQSGAQTQHMQRQKSGSPCGEPNRTNNHGVPVKGQGCRAIAVPLVDDECATGIALAR